MWPAEKQSGGQDGANSLPRPALRDFGETPLAEGAGSRIEGAYCINTSFDSRWIIQLKFV